MGEYSYEFVCKRNRLQGTLVKYFLSDLVKFDFQVKISYYFCTKNNIQFIISNRITNVFKMFVVKYE